MHRVFEELGVPAGVEQRDWRAFAVVEHLLLQGVEQIAHRGAGGHEADLTLSPHALVHLLPDVIDERPPHVQGELLHGGLHPVRVGDVVALADRG